VKKVLLILLLSIAFTQGENVQLMSFYPFEQETSDITGFAQDGREFAVIGLQNAAAFIDVTDPNNPFEVGRILGSQSIWRDLKYWNEHVYIGTEANDGVKIVNVSNLDEPILVNTITDVDNSHNIHIDADGYLYIVGADIYDTWIYDLSNPENPELVGTWNGEYLHDIEVYNNKLYGGAIYSGYLYIIDVSDKSNPTTILSFDTGGGYVSTHDCAVTLDEQFLITADETMGGHVKIYDISDYDNIHQVGEYFTPDFETHTVHNIYIQESTGLLVMSHYADGTRFVNISDPSNPQEVGYYDTTELEGLYAGNWGTYVNLPSGNVVSSDTEQGLFVLRFGGLSINHTHLGDRPNNGLPIIVEASVTSIYQNVMDVDLHYNILGEWETIQFEDFGEDMYEIELPINNFPTVVKYYITAEDDGGNTSRNPQSGNIIFVYGELETHAEYDFESGPQQWISGSPFDDATSGIWEWGNPNGTADQNGAVQPEDDHTLDGVNCFITGNGGGAGSVGADDVDGGITTLFSPILDLTDMDDALFSYWRWYINNAGDNPGNDHWVVDVSNNGGSTWTPIEDTNDSSREWQQKRFLLSDFIPLSNQIQFKFIAKDEYYDGDNGSGGSVVEAALDDVHIQSVYYYECVADGDVNGDGSVNVLDIVNTVNAILDESLLADDLVCAADLNQDSIVNILDVVIMVNIILG